MWKLNWKLLWTSLRNLWRLVCRTVGTGWKMRKDPIRQNTQVVVVQRHEKVRGQGEGQSGPLPWDRTERNMQEYWKSKEDAKAGMYWDWRNISEQGPFQIDEQSLCCSTMKHRLMEDLSNKAEALGIDSRASELNNNHPNIEYYQGASQTWQVHLLLWLLFWKITISN